MEIKSTNEIAGNIIGKVFFNCPFCNSEKVTDIPDEGRWHCKKCQKYFFEPISSVDMGIPLDKNWVSIDSIIDELKSLEPEFGSDVDFPIIYEIICQLDKYKTKNTLNDVQ